MNLREREFSIGRRRDCDIVLNDDSVSRIHAQLTFLKDGKILLTDCRSTHGTFISGKDNEKEVHQELISPMDRLRFGDVTLSVREILESIRLKFPAFQSTPVRGAEESEPRHKMERVKGRQLVRCECGQVMVKGDKCPECGNEG